MEPSPYDAQRDVIAQLIRAALNEQARLYSDTVREVSRLGQEVRDLVDDLKGRNGNPGRVRVIELTLRKAEKRLNAHRLTLGILISFVAALALAGLKIFG